MKWNPLTLISNAWYMVYENWGWYKANPCDVGASRHLAGLTWAFSMMGSHCRCCSGVRVVLAFVLGATLQTWSAAWIIGMFALVVVIATVAHFLDFDLKDGHE